MRKKPTPELIEMGQRLKQLRLTAGYTSQEKFAFTYNFSRVLYHGWESGRGNITYMNLMKLCKIFRVTPAEFFKPFTK